MRRSRTVWGWLLAAALILACCAGVRIPTPARAEEESVFGDADGDGEITSTDARMVLQVSVGKLGPEAIRRADSDADGDGEITSTDARMILQASVGKIELTPPLTEEVGDMRLMKDMPGLAESPLFSMRVRPASGGEWKDVKVFYYKSDRYNSMARVTSSVPVEVEVTDLNGRGRSLRLVPERYGVTPSAGAGGKTVTFVAQPMQKFAMRFGDDKTWLVFAVDPPEEDPPSLTDENVVNVLDFVEDNQGKTDVYAGIDAAVNYMLDTPGKDTLYFPDGIYRTHSIELALVDDISFYISEGARILWDENCWGSNVFRLSGCNNIRIYGRGIIDATYRVHKGRGASGNGWWDAVNLTHLSGRISNGLVVDGLWFFDTPNSPMRTEGGNNALFYNTKYINYGGIMNDNLVVYGGSHVIFDEGIGTGDDDSWSAHTAAWGGFTDTRDVIIRNSTYIADGVEGRGGICYGCNESNPDRNTSTWNVLFENLSLVDYGEALDSYNTPVNGCHYGNFIFRNVHFETHTATGKAFDSFTDLSGTVVLDGCTFADRGGTIAGNPNEHIKELYIRDLTMAGKEVNTQAQGDFRITNCDAVFWNSEDTPLSFEPGPVVEPPAPVPVSELPISDTFEDGTLSGWTDLSGSVKGTANASPVSRQGNRCLQLNDTESCGLAGAIRRFTPQGAGQVVEIGLEVTPSSVSRIANVYIDDRVGAAVAGVRFYNNGKIRWFSGKGSNFEPGVEFMSYQAGVTYRLKWVIDVSACRYDLYVAEGDGPLIKAVGNVSFKCPLPNVASLRLDTESLWLVYAGQKTSFLADNVTVISYPSDGTLFDPADTRIHTAVIGENLQMVNDNASSVRYSSGWSYAGGRSFGDYENDVHFTTENGASVTFTFTGTGVRFFSEAYTDEGEIAVTLDGTDMGSVSGYAEERSMQQKLFEARDLAPGEHVLTLTKVSGKYMLVDAFGVLTE